eukprot:5571839-Prymnesium_polylepis.2
MSHARQLLRLLAGLLHLGNVVLSPKEDIGCTVADGSCASHRDSNRWTRTASRALLSIEARFAPDLPQIDPRLSGCTTERTPCAGLARLPRPPCVLCGFDPALVTL